MILRKLGAVLVLAFAYLASNSLAAERPNVVFVITDDQGYGDLSCHGNPVLQTPNLDRLFSESIRLTDYHVSPTCSPTRAALLTGRWSNRTGVWHTIMGRSMLRDNEITVGQIFRDAGYATGMFGKWHLGDNFPYRPEDRGFQEVVRHGGGGVGQTPDYWDNAYFDGTYWHNGVPTPAEGFCTDVFFEDARRFIEQQSKSGQPFFAYISTNAPHGPMHSPLEFSEPYAAHGVHLANFFGMIANADKNIGDLRRLLDELKLTENTIFIFTTDNGTSSGHKVFDAGMRGAKGSEFDGGHRVPFFLHWPGGGFDTAEDIREITAHVDVVPTLLELCSLEPPRALQFDGVSLVPLLRKTALQWPDRVLITDSQRVKDPIKWKQSCVMTSRWRLINGRQLFDVNVDPGQQRDVATGYPDIVNLLRAAYDDWWNELEPTFAQQTPITIGHPQENPARLTAHDWITTNSTPWNQANVRAAMSGEQNTGYWNIHVHQDGRYRFRLRRWPEETGLSIDAPLDPGSPVSGERAFRMTPGKAIRPTLATMKTAGTVSEKAIEPGMLEVEFELLLKAGLTTLETTLADDKGNVYGAYYVYVERQ